MAFELILQLVSPFDALEPSLETVRVAGIRVFRGTAPLGAYHRADQYIFRILCLSCDTQPFSGR